jgi:hypothetical protein
MFHALHALPLVFALTLGGASAALAPKKGPHTGWQHDNVVKKVRKTKTPRVPKTPPPKTPKMKKPSRPRKKKAPPLVPVPPPQLQPTGPAPPGR